MTTVGFGDITPKTDFGRFIASVMMLLGWGTLAVPTGIVSAEFTAHAPAPRRADDAHLPRLPVAKGTSRGARFCKDCGAKLQRYFTDLPAASRRRRHPGPP